MTLESEPQVAPEHPAPESDQFTPRFRKSLETVAARACVPYADGRKLEPGETLTEMGATEPLIERNAARPAPQLSEVGIEAEAATVPAALCNWSSATSLVFGEA